MRKTVVEIIINTIKKKNNMETILSLLMIATIVVFIVDVSGAVDSLKTALKWILTKGRMSDSNYILKPIDCSLCMTFWSCVIFLLVTNHFTLFYVTVSCLIAWFAGIIKNTILLVEDSVTTIIKLIYKLIDKAL